MSKTYSNNISIPTIKERERGNKIEYYVWLPAKYSDTGKRKMITGSTSNIVEKKFRKAVEIYLDYNYIANEQILDFSDATVGELVRQHLLMRNDISAQSKRVYMTVYKAHIKDSDFGKIPIKKVKKFHCEYFLQGFITKNYSYSTIIKAKAILSSSFEFAVDEEFMSKNPIRTIKINKKLCPPPFSKRYNGVWTTVEIKILQEKSLEAWNSHKKYRYSAVILILIFTGMRIGELLSLTWDHLDFSNNTIHIDSTQVIEFISEDYSETTCSTPKSDSSHRYIYMNKYSRFWFLEMKRRNTEKKINSNYVICRRNGTMLTETEYFISHNRFLEKIGLEHKTSHICRKTFATILYTADEMKLLPISKTLGHASTSTTLKYYIKNQPEKLESDFQNMVFDKEAL